MKFISKNYKSNSKINLKSNYSLFCFLLVHFRKSKIGPLISLIAPLMFMIFYYSISNFNKFTWTFVESLTLYVSLAILPLSILTLPQIIVELKNSILLRKIKTSGFSKFNFIFVVFCVYFLLSLIFIMINFCFFFIFLLTKKDWKNVLSKLPWEKICYSIFNIILVSISTGIIISSFLKNLLITQIFGFTIFILILVLSGSFIPLEISSDILAIKIFQSISPINNGINLLTNSTRFTYEWTFYSILKVLQGNDQNAIKSLVKILNSLGISPDLGPLKIIELVKKGNDIFKPNYNFYFFFTLGDKATQLNKEPIDGILLLTSLQKWLDLFLPYFYTIIFISISSKYFSWHQR